MAKLSFPIRVPTGQRLVVTQIFGDKSKVDWYHANGLNISEHNGIDIVLSGGPIATYGAALICPVAEAVINRRWFDTPMSSKGNGLAIEYVHEGDNFILKAWHCSEIVVKKKYYFGDVFGYLGNSGLVDPKPITSAPFQGSHLHLMLYKNGVLIDPAEYFDVNRPFVGPDTGEEKDFPPLYWAAQKLKEQLALLADKIADYLRQRDKIV